MNATVALRVVGVDVANTVFQLAVADSAWRVTEERCTCARLGVKRIARVLADPHSGVLEARVAQLARAWLQVLWPCPECAMTLSVYDHSEEREWRHLDSCQFKTFLQSPQGALFFTPCPRRGPGGRAKPSGAA